MPLDVTGLQNAIKAAFDAAIAPTKQTPPATPDPNQLPKDLAAAISAFVKSGEVVKVKMSIADNAGNPSQLTATQSGAGKLQ
jgi:hypothetical protein